MNIAHRLGLRGTLITLGVVLALAAVVTISNTPAHASSTPDLEVTRLSPMYDFPLFTGESFYLNATVENKGDGESATTTLRFYQSSDSTITTSDTELGTIALGTLAAGVSRIRQSPELTAPSTAGVYYYGACVDSVSGESDTSNNCPDFSTFLRVEDPGPNLGTTRINVEYDSPLITEESLYLKATIENSGDEESPTTTVRYYQSSDNTITAADTELGTAAIDALESGTSTIVNLIARTARRCVRRADQPAMAVPGQECDNRAARESSFDGLNRLFRSTTFRYENKIATLPEPDTVQGSSTSYPSGGSCQGNPGRSLHPDGGRWKRKGTTAWWSRSPRSAAPQRGCHAVGRSVGTLSSRYRHRVRRQIGRAASSPVTASDPNQPQVTVSVTVGGV